MTRVEKAEIKVKALERIMAKPLSYDESIYFGERLAQADAQLNRAREARLSKRQKRINALLAQQNGIK